MHILENLPPVVLALLASIFTYSMTAIGAMVVFFFKKINKKVLDVMLGFSSGIMVAAAFWSLIAPAIELSAELGKNKILMPALGFMVGGAFLVIISIFIDNKLKKTALKKNNGALKHKSSFLLVLSITLHNIPEGMAVGIAFGGFALGVPGCTLIGALLVALGIGLQNFPEGAAVSLPLRRDGLSRTKAFLIGQSSGLVEPVAALLGFALTYNMRTIMPFMLSFSAGAMICVVVGELIPEATRENKALAVAGTLVGFLVMMVLDVALSF